MHGVTMVGVGGEGRGGSERIKLCEAKSHVNNTRGERAYIIII